MGQIQQESIVRLSPLPDMQRGHREDQNNEDMWIGD